MTTTTNLLLERQVPALMRTRRHPAPAPRPSDAAPDHATTRDPTKHDENGLIPITGILDVHDDHAFVRASGYLPAQGDGYLAISQVRRYGLRRGDQITGLMRATDRNGAGSNGRRWSDPVVQIERVNGLDPLHARNRPEFHTLTPLYPQERLRLETEAHILTTRVIDLVMPIGKGQRALIVAPPKAGKTMVLQSIADAIARNNPECHLMVVLVDERPEEVTDIRRSVKGEVIASAFDRPPADHVALAELSIERAKRLVELGGDVVVLLDSITRLGRSYNNLAPGNGRVLTGGIDASALYPPKRLLGAARNIENGGSLTILATALVETGSVGDSIIYEEFKGAGNAELRLNRTIADRRIYPAIDLAPSGTRMEDILLAPQELAIMQRLRRALQPLSPAQAIERLVGQLRRTGSNTEFLLTLARSAGR